MPLSHSISRRLRSDSHHNGSPSRTFSSRSGKQVHMGEISMPVNLLSTTNVLSYEAPDVSVAQKSLKISPQATLQAPRESHSANSAMSTEPGLTDGSSVESSPAVEHNHLSCYFPGPTASRTMSTRKTMQSDDNVPALPQRAPSHSKREHERLARKRSQRSTPSHISSAPSSPSGDRTSFDMIGNSGSDPPHSPTLPTPSSSVFAAPISSNHPFGHELEQLNEVAETFNDVTRRLEDEEDIEIMRQRGLSKFTVDDYISEIGFLFPTTPFQAGIGQQDNNGGWI